MNFEDFGKIATTIGIPISIILIVIFIISQAHNILLLKGEICGLFAHVSSKAHKSFLSSKISGSIASLSQKISKGDSEILPPALKIEWVKDETTDSFIHNEQAIVRIKQNKNPQENLISATSTYVNIGLLHNHKRYIDDNVIKASRLAMIRKIIQESGKNSITFFEENYLPEYLNNDAEIAQFYEQLRDIDKNGMFVNILLKEFLKAADSIFGEKVDPCLIAESRELLKFLYDIASRDREEDTKLELNTNYFKIAIMLAAHDIVLGNKGIKPYVRRIKRLINKGYDTIYFFGVGSKKRVADSIAKALNSDKEMIIYPTGYKYQHTSKDGYKKDAVLYEITLKI